MSLQGGMYTSYDSIDTLTREYMAPTEGNDMSNNKGDVSDKRTDVDTSMDCMDRSQLDDKLESINQDVCRIFELLLSQSSHDIGKSGEFFCQFCPYLPFFAILYFAILPIFPIFANFGQFCRLLGTPRKTNATVDAMRQDLISVVDMLQSRHASIDQLRAGELYKETLHTLYTYFTYITYIRYIHILHLYITYIT